MNYLYLPLLNSSKAVKRILFKVSCISEFFPSLSTYTKLSSTGFIKSYLIRFINSVLNKHRKFSADKSVGTRYIFK